jgi:hypothetical protein
MAYLTFFDFCDKEICDAVRICVWDLMQVDIASFEIKQSWTQLTLNCMVTQQIIWRNLNITNPD